MNADEALHQGVVALRDWLAFLEERRRDATRQLERARKAQSAAPAQADDAGALAASALADDAASLSAPGTENDSVASGQAAEERQDSWL